MRHQQSEEFTPGARHPAARPEEETLGETQCFILSELERNRAAAGELKQIGLEPSAPAVVPCFGITLLENEVERASALQRELSQITDRPLSPSTATFEEKPSQEFIATEEAFRLKEVHLFLLQIQFINCISSRRIYLYIFLFIISNV